LNQIDKILLQDCQLKKSDLLVLGVSGGPDSLCLLDLCVKAGYRVIVGHMNHHLREEADEEEVKVINFCREFKIPCVVEQADIRDHASKNHMSIEESARKLRYRFLFKLAKSHDAKAVLVAHNQDDQVETILMHLIRGSGMKGLRGMDYRFLPNEWSEVIPVVRPLMHFSKAEILNYCAQNNLEPALDQSNQDTTFFRNKLRKELVPYLESFNLEIKQRLLDMANVLRFEDDYLQQMTANALSKIVTESGSSYFVIARKELSELHPAIIRRCFFTVMKRLNPESDNITFDCVNRALEFVNNPSMSSKTELAAHLELCRYLTDYLLVSDVRQFPHELWPQVNTKEDLILRRGSSVRMNGQWCLTVNEELPVDNYNRWSARLDATKIGNLRLSSFENGDRFMPLGMGGKVLKLGDYWTNQGLPLKARPNWPLIRSNEEIIWVPGFTINEAYKITNSTRKTISIELINKA